MKRFGSRYYLLLILIGAGVLFAGCKTLIATYDQQAVDNAVEIKTQALAVMDEATGDFSAHSAEVDALRARVEEAYEYAAATPRNKPSTRQWMVLKDPDRDLLGGFLKEWEEKGSLSQVYVDEKKNQIADAFDSIIELENAKRPA